MQARLRRLESRGVIAGYRALIDPEAVGKPLSAFIEITPLDPAQPDNAPEQLAHLVERHDAREAEDGSWRDEECFRASGEVVCGRSSPPDWGAP